MNTQKQFAFLIRIAYYSVIFFISYLFLKYWMYEIMPFLIGFAIACLLRPIIRFLSKKTGISQRITGVFTILLFYATIGLCITLLFMEGYAYLSNTLPKLPVLYKEQIEPSILSYISSLQMKLMNQHPGLIAQIQEILFNMNSSFQQMLQSFSNNIIRILASTLSSFPNLIMSTAFSICSSFLFVFDYQKITTFIMRQFSPRYQSLLQDSKYFIIQTLWNLVIGYGKLMIITFFQLVIGLLYLKVDHAITIAFIISLFDFFPLLGTSGFMIPWIIIEFLLSHPKRATGLIVLSLIMTIVRNIIEPKVLGNQIGLHPLMMLFCMYIGGKLFGLFGFLFFPIIIICIHNLNEHKKIHVYKTMDSS